MQGGNDHVGTRCRALDRYDRARVLPSVVAAHNKAMHALNCNTEAGAATNTENDNFRSNELNLKKLFWEYDGPKKISCNEGPNEMLLTWEKEMGFHGFSTKDNWGLRVNIPNGKLHQIIGLLPVNERPQQHEKESKMESEGVVLPNGRVFAGVDFTKWRLRAKNMKECFTIQKDCVIKCYELNDDVEVPEDEKKEDDEPDDKKNVIDVAKDVENQNDEGETASQGDDEDVAVISFVSVAVEGAKEVEGQMPDGDADFGNIKGLYWIGVESEQSRKAPGDDSLAVSHTQNIDEKCIRKAYQTESLVYRELEVVLSLSKTVHHDWRVLELKVALYNLLREDFFSDPIGRQNVVPERRPQKTERFNLRLRCELRFKAVALSDKAVIEAFENRSFLVDGEEWSLFHPDVVLIYLNEEQRSLLSTSLWTLAHLEYPLAQVVDSYLIRWNLNEAREGAFIRTAGLVDIPTGSPRRIVFCVPEENVETIEMFDMPLKVVHNTGVLVSSWDAGPLLDSMIWCVLRSKSDLRVVFNEYTSTMKSDENACHWLEIDALVNLLVVRWSRQSEAHVVTNDGHLGMCLERVSVGEEAIKHRGVRNGNCTRRVWDDYNDVSSVDATFLSRSEAREKPFLTLRCWSNESEFCFSKKRCSYADAGKAGSVLNGSCLQTGALGTLKRAAFLRVFYEEWKKKMGIGDEIVAPKLFRFLGSCYTCLEDSKEFGSVQDFLYKDVFLYPIPISVSWEMNRDNDVDVTLTGIRTGPIHRNFASWQREWNQFSIDDLSTVYVALSGWFVQKSIVRSIAQKDEFNEMMHWLVSIGLIKVIISARQIT